MATVAVTKIKFNGKVFEPGDKVNKKDFSTKEWADLVEAGAVGPEPAKPLTVAEEEEEEEATLEDEEALEDKSVEELRELAAELDIPGRSAMLKDDLVAAIEKAEAAK